MTIIITTLTMIMKSNYYIPSVFPFTLCCISIFMIQTSLINFLIHFFYISKYSYFNNYILYRVFLFYPFSSLPLFLIYLCGKVGTKALVRVYIPTHLMQNCVYIRSDFFYNYVQPETILCDKNKKETRKLFNKQFFLLLFSFAYARKS